MAAFVAGIFMNDFVEFRSDTRATSKTRLNEPWTYVSAGASVIGATRWGLVHFIMERARCIDCSIYNARRAP